jgi:hypothetical protein
MDGRPPRACRWLIAAAGHIVSRPLRPEWRMRWDKDVWNWWAFHAEHGAFDRYARAELIRHCWGAFPDALGTRVEMVPQLARALHGPVFCILAAALPLLAAALFSHGFSGVRAILTPLPYADPGRVVVLAETDPLRLETVADTSLAVWRNARRLDGLAAYRLRDVRLDGRPALEARIEPNFFAVLGAKPALGRLFAPEDARTEPLAVLSHAAWLRIFGGNPGAIGRAVSLDGKSFRVLGVLPPEFWFFRREIAVWTILTVPPPVPAPVQPGYELVRARLAGRTVTEARVEAPYFDAFNVKPAQGRLFTRTDASGAPVAVLAHSAWQDIFQSDPAVVGREVTLNDGRVTVAGVLPPESLLPAGIAVWTILKDRRPVPADNPPRYGAIARLKPFAHPLDGARELSNIVWEIRPHRNVWIQMLPIAERLRSAGKWCGGLSCLAFAGACLLALAGFQNNLRGALFLVAKAALLIAGLAALDIEIPAALNGAGSAGRGYLVEPIFLISVWLVVWWCWRDQRRRCRTCLYRLTLPVSFGNYGSPLLDRVGTELVCERGHGTLYVPGMHWSSSQPERWTRLDDSWEDLFSAKPPKP